MSIIYNLLTLIHYGDRKKHIFSFFDIAASSKQGVKMPLKLLTFMAFIENFKTSNQSVNWIISLKC